MNADLPLDSGKQVYVTVYALHAGSFFLQDKEVFEGSLGYFAFLVEHPSYGRLMLDLGLRKNGKGYPPAWDETLQEFTVKCSKDVVDILGEGHIQPSSINTVDRLHFNHVGDLLPFASAELVLGAGAANLMQHAYPHDPESLCAAFPEGQKVRYVHFGNGMPMSDQISPLGSFDHGMDLFKDGSFYLIDAPGHFPVHLAALARVAPNNFLLLAADCCHNRLCYDPGKRLISHENYDDIETARDTVEKLKIMNGLKNVLLILAHEKERLDEMPLFPTSLNVWARRELENKAKRSGSE
ncbi:uncharacterized protein LAESUDRAFT_736609 [Laetiporus sulphureus 93-53]|uniref:Metallo-beta-lactamase domain-containing protein n=1 Tax=Laetiporus sulphureus 93-53 TaxID=1314785 RepID=A0A165EH96_9APHY|nr:uncharacterized protein LAESUDRAFT_736609 [Laetiporus sulphureus 93-53]KZT07050.1 hypothetical protein LAESUDRAFT_736609 [Laetiporus sulphureus 93-53]